MGYPGNDISNRVLDLIGIELWPGLTIIVASIFTPKMVEDHERRKEILAEILRDLVNKFVSTLQEFDFDRVDIFPVMSRHASGTCGIEARMNKVFTKMLAAVVNVNLVTEAFTRVARQSLTKYKLQS